MTYGQIRELPGQSATFARFYWPDGSPKRWFVEDMRRHGLQNIYGDMPARALDAAAPQTSAGRRAQSRDCEHSFRTVDSQRRRADDRRARLHAVLDRLLDRDRRAQDFDPDQDLELGDSGERDFEPDQRDPHFANLKESDRRPAHDAADDRANARLEAEYALRRQAGATSAEVYQPADQHGFDSSEDRIAAEHGCKPWETPYVGI